jgi:hypothetical protein
VPTATQGNRLVVLHLTGRIDSQDAASFDAALGKLTGAGKRIDVVSLNSTGGQLGEGALIAGVIKALRLSTRVEDGAVCASACFLLIAAGEGEILSLASTRQPTMTAARPTSRARRPAQWSLRGNSGCPRRSPTRWAERHRMASSG